MRYNPHFDRLDRHGIKYDAELNCRAKRRAELEDDIDIAYMESEVFETEDLTLAIDDNDSEEYCQLRSIGLTHPETKGAK